jgi:hypothetical protein
MPKDEMKKYRIDVQFILEDGNPIILSGEFDDKETIGKVYQDLFKGDALGPNSARFAVYKFGKRLNNDEIREELGTNWIRPSIPD